MEQLRQPLQTGSEAALRARLGKRGFNGDCIRHREAGAIGGSSGGRRLAGYACVCKLLSAAVDE